MADYLPLFKPGQTFTQNASAAIVGGQLLANSGVNSVAPAAAASLKWLGVAAFDAPNGEPVTIHVGGVQRLVASGAVTAGDQVAAAAAGQVATSATASADGTLVGIALNTVANGALVDVLMNR